MDGKWNNRVGRLHPTFLLLIFALCNCIGSVRCFEIPLPGGGRVKFESGGVVRIQYADVTDLPEVPPIGTLPNKSTLSSIVVRDTGRIKGYGAFCCSPLDKGTFLGFYEGRRIESREELERIITNMDYVMSIDGG